MRFLVHQLSSVLLGDSLKRFRHMVEVGGQNEHECIYYFKGLVEQLFERTLHERTTSCILSLELHHAKTEEEASCRAKSTSRMRIHFGPILAAALLTD